MLQISLRITPYLEYCLANITSGLTAVTANYTAAQGTTMLVAEYSGVSCAVDTLSTSNAAQQTLQPHAWWTTINAITPVSGQSELIFSLDENNNANTPITFTATAAGFSAVRASGLSYNDAAYVFASHRIVASTSGSYTSSGASDSATDGGNNTPQIVAFIAAPPRIQVSSRSDTLSDARPSATSNHTFTFKGEQRYLWQFCVWLKYADTLTLDPAFTIPAGMDCGDVDAATSVQFSFNYPGCQATATAWGFMATGSVIVLTPPSGTGVYVPTSTQVTIKIGSNATAGQQGGRWITNPSAGSIYTIAVGGTLGGSGNMLVSINSGVTVQATVAESLAFTASSVNSVNCTADDGATVNSVTSTATSVPFGTISPNTFYQGCQDLIVSTNAGNGYSVTVQESSAMKTANGQFTIPDTTCDAADCTVVTATTWVTPTKNGFGHTCSNQSGSDCNATYGSGKKFKPVPSIPIGKAPGNISLVQTVDSGTCSVGTCTSRSAVFGSANTAGNTIIVFAYWDITSNNVTAISDRSSNASVTVGSKTCVGGSNTCGQFFYAANIAGGTNTTTVTLSSGANHLGIDVYEYSGLATANTLDTWAGQAAPASTNYGTTPLISTSFPNELLLAGFADVVQSGTITAGTGWRVELAHSTFYSGSEDQIVSLPGNYQGTATLPVTDNQWLGVIAAFRSSNTSVAIMSNTGTVTNSTGQVKYRLSAGSAQPAGTYTTIITYTIYAAY